MQVCARIARQSGLLGRISIGQNKRRLLASGFLTAGSINWERTEAYSLGFEGAIYTVGERHSEIAQEVAEGLQGLQEPGNGGHLVDSVHRAQDLYEGKLVEYAPSLILELAGGRYSASQKMFAPQLVTTPTDSGTHSPTGILGVWGPGAAAVSQCQRLDLQAVSGLLLEIVQAGARRGKHAG